MDNLIQIAVLLAVGGLLILAGSAAVYIFGRIKSSTTPGIQAVLDALLPYVYRGIVAGEKLAVEGLDDIDRKLDGTDKAAVANSIYDTLTGIIYIGDKPVPIDFVKRLVSREMFAGFIKRVYDETDAFIERNRDYLEKQIPAEVPAPDPAFTRPIGSFGAGGGTITTPESNG